MFRVSDFWLEIRDQNWVPSILPYIFWLNFVAMKKKKNTKLPTQKNWDLENHQKEFWLILYEKKINLEMKSSPEILYNNPHNIQCCFELLCYLMDCIPFWIQYKLHNNQFENESRPHCLKRHGWEEWNHHNTFPSWMIYLNHHHKWSRNHSWKDRLFFLLIWQ